MFNYIRVGTLYLFFLSIIIEICFRIEVSTIPGLNLKNIAVLLILFVIFVGNIIEKKPVIAGNRMNLPIILFMCTCFLSMYITYTFKLIPNYNLLGEILLYRQYMEAFLYLILCYNLLHDIESIKNILISLLVLYFFINMLALIGSLGVIQVGKAEMEKGIRFSGVFGGPNQFSAFIALFIPFAISMFLHHKKSVIKAILICLIVFSFFCLLLTGSRGGIVAAFVGITTIIILSRKTKSFLFVIKLASAWFLITILLLVALFLLPETSRIALKANLVDRAIDKEAVVEYRTDYSSGRIDLWLKALTTFIENPVIGSGWLQNVELSQQ